MFCFERASSKLEDLVTERRLGNGLDRIEGVAFYFIYWDEPLPSARITRRRKDEKRQAVERRTEREPEILI